MAQDDRTCQLPDVLRLPGVVHVFLRYPLPSRHWGHRSIVNAQFRARVATVLTGLRVHALVQVLSLLLVAVQELRPVLLHSLHLLCLLGPLLLLEILNMLDLMLELEIEVRLLLLQEEDQPLVIAYQLLLVMDLLPLAFDLLPQLVLAVCMLLRSLGHDSDGSEVVLVGSRSCRTFEPHAGL